MVGEGAMSWPLEQALYIAAEPKTPATHATASADFLTHRRNRQFPAGLLMTTRAPGDPPVTVASYIIWA